MPLGESHETCQEPVIKENIYSNLKEKMRNYIFKENEANFRTIFIITLYIDYKLYTTMRCIVVDLYEIFKILKILSIAPQVGCKHIYLYDTFIMHETWSTSKTLSLDYF